MLPRRKCELCGTSVDPDTVKYRKNRGLSIICRSCIAEERVTIKAERIRAKKALLAERRCVVCGGQIPWKDLYLKKSVQYWPITCSTRCHGLQSKRDSRMTKAQAEDRIREYIRSIGRASSYADVVRGCRISSRVLTKLGISVQRIQKEILGLHISRTSSECVQATRAYLTRQQFCLMHGIDEVDWRVLAAVVRTRICKDKVSCKILEDFVVSYITEAKHYCSKSLLYHVLFRTDDRIWPYLKGLNVDLINLELGYKNPKRSWYELETAAYLQSLFGKNVSSEHTFPDLRSSKGYPLRYDFFVPIHNLLVEIDGGQHTSKKNKYHTDQLEQNDRLKDAYAHAHGYVLIRVATEPRNTFLDRLHGMILGVLKPVELLEPLPGNAGGNQQPSPEHIWEGSETIERHVSEPSRVGIN